MKHRRASANAAAGLLRSSPSCPAVVRLPAGRLGRRPPEAPYEGAITLAPPYSLGNKPCLRFGKTTYLDSHPAE
jgi:hypothetical protein